MRISFELLYRFEAKIEMTTASLEVLSTDMDSHPVQILQPPEVGHERAAAFGPHAVPRVCIANLFSAAGRV